MRGESEIYDVAVVGAGPAGSSAAHDLARRGARVVLIEKACLPRYKTCGGGLVNRAYQLLPGNVAPAVERECRVAELNFLKHGLYFETRRDAPIIHLTMRSSLDHQLAIEAQRAGAQLEQGCAVRFIFQRDDRVETETRLGR